MVIGVPKEIKDHEYRVSVTPDGVRALRQAGHDVWIEPSAGVGSGYSDEDYRSAGATMAESKEQLFQQATLIVKVKEPLLSECRFFRPGQTLFTYLHLASLPDLTKALLDTTITAIAYETIEAKDGTLPMLKPMSEIAGRMSVQIGARYLEKTQGGRGLLLAGVPGVEPGKVVVLGAGVVGSAATRIAVGMGAQVTVINLELERLRALDELYRGRIVTRASTQAAIDGVSDGRRSCYRGGPRSWGSSAQVGLAWTGGAHEARSRGGGRRGRSRRLLRDHETHDPFGPGLCGGRGAPLLCGQYAGDCSSYVDCRVDECHASVSSASGLAGGGGGRAGRRWTGERGKPVWRQDYLSRGGRCPWLAFRPPDVRQSLLASWFC